MQERLISLGGKVQEEPASPRWINHTDSSRSGDGSWYHFTDGQFHVEEDLLRLGGGRPQLDGELDEL